MACISNKKVRVTQQERGFALIIAVLVSSIVLSIGVAMFNVSVKQTVLSSTGKESQISFFAADAGIECAEYWEYKIPSSFTAPVVTPITCNGQTIAVTSISATPPYTEAVRFVVSTTYGGSATDACAIVTIQKNATPATVIESRGYNTGDTTGGNLCTSSDPRRTERGIRISQ